MNISESLLVEVTRGNMVESRHRVIGAVVHASGDVIDRWGDADQLVYPRSAIKPVQALPLLDTGAAEAYGLSDAEVALACASHSGERAHVDAVAAWLGRIGLGEDDLECGPHRPIGVEAADDLVRAGRSWTRLHNNCSGKHTGFLTTALHMGEATAGYITGEHPVQQRVLDAAIELSGTDLSRTPRGADGCGIPVIAMPLVALARAVARVAGPDGLAPARRDAARRVVQAMTAHPHLVAGAGRIDTDVMAALGDVVLKGGAEGVHVAIIPERGVGVAVKALDGAARASDAAIIWVLRYLGVIGPRASEALAQWADTPVTNTLGEKVGAVRVIEVREG